MDLVSAAAMLEKELKALFGEEIRVMHQRGILVTFERESKDDFLKRQMSLPWDQKEGDHVSVLVGLIPAGGGKFDMKLMNSKADADALKSRGIAVKRQTAPTLERGVDYVVLWFKKNEAALKAAVGA